MDLKLRPYQKECVQAVLNDLNQHNKIGIVMPTGSGKTVCFGSIIKQYQQQNPHKRVIVVSHLSLLIEQTKHRLEQDFDIETEVLQGSDLPYKAKCVVTTMQSLCKEEKIIRWAKSIQYRSADIKKLSVGLLIIDECHLIGCDTYDTILDLFPNVNVVGFTATPFRSNKLMSDFFDVISYTISMGELIEGGYLVEPDLNLVEFNTWDTEELYSSLINICEKHPKEKIVIYLKTIQECLDARNILVDYGLVAEAITSRMSNTRRNTVLKEFNDNEGKVSILLTVNVLTAGVDFPALTVLIIPYKVNSVVTYLQRVGRALRPYTGKTKCYIYAGSNSPGISKGFWEKIHTQMLKQGRKEYDNYLDEYEFDKRAMDKQKYEWTKRIVELAKLVKKKGMSNLHNLIVRKEFPRRFLDCLLEAPPSITNKSEKMATAGQLEYISKHINCPVDLTKNEANALSLTIRRSLGEIKKEELVKEGMHKGKHYSEVPHAYWYSIRKKYPGSPLLRDLENYKKLNKEIKK